jgi:hypothetical protein
MEEDSYAVSGSSVMICEVHDFWVLKSQVVCFPTMHI